MKPVARYMVFAILLLSMLGGCTWLEPVTITPLNQTIAIVDDLGHALGAFEIMGGGTIYVDFGDGETASFDVDTSLAITHEYHFIGEYIVTAARGNHSAQAAVSVIAEGLIVDPPFVLNWIVEEDERINFGIPRRDVGCDGGTGAPLYTSGIAPGPGTTEFRIMGYTEDGDKVGLFDSQGNYVWGEWIPLADPSEGQEITCWAWWTEDEPPIPMVPTPYPRGEFVLCPWCEAKVTEQNLCVIAKDGESATYRCPSCWTLFEGIVVKGCPPGDPWINPTIPEEATWMKFSIEARNEYMPLRYAYPIAIWKVYVTRRGCD